MKRQIAQYIQELKQFKGGNRLAMAASTAATLGRLPRKDCVNVFKIDRRPKAIGMTGFSGHFLEIQPRELVRYLLRTAGPVRTRFDQSGGSIGFPRTGVSPVSISNLNCQTKPRRRWEVRSPVP